MSNVRAVHFVAPFLAPHQNSTTGGKSPSPQQNAKETRLGS